MGEGVMDMGGVGSGRGRSARAMVFGGDARGRGRSGGQQFYICEGERAVDKTDLDTDRTAWSAIASGQSAGPAARGPRGEYCSQHAAS